MAQGRFPDARPLLSFSTDRVDIEVLEGKDYAGDFVITSENGVRMRGVVYTSDARMECLTPQFEGEEVRIRYQFHSNGLVEGDIQKGEFFIVCDQGEYDLSFVASISRLYAEASVGRVRNLNDFASLARQSAGEAYQLFYSPGFYNVIADDEGAALLLYQGFRQGAPSGQKAEEFLVGIRKKLPVTFSLSAAEAECELVTESRRETVELTKSQWGFVDIRVSSDADFLVPEKQRLTEDDFLGSICEFPYYIREEALHAGWNFGRLRFAFPGGELSFAVRASRRRKKRAVTRTGRQETKEGRVRLLKLYLDYRLKRIVTGAWTNRSVEVLDHLMALEPEEEMYPLMKAQALIVNRQRQEAAWLMEEYKRSCMGENAYRRETPVWGYYLYLCTLMEREPSYVDRVAEEIERLFQKHPKNPVLFWVLLFVRESYYRDHAKRYRAIEQWMESQENRSPYLYLEAYYLLCQDPYLLRRLDAFEIRVLGWARKQNAITRDIAMQVLHLAAGKRSFDLHVYRLLESCYEVAPGDEALTVVCGYLIKGQRYENRYHVWYEQGIARELRLTGLYEAYLMSMDTREVRTVPKMLQMYFQYDSALSYQQKAVLFVNIIAGKRHQPEVYQKYRRMMEQFAMEQMEAGRISDNLAIVYDEILRTGVPNAEIAHRLGAILFTHKLTVMEEGVVQAIVWHEELREPQVVAVTDGVAYFQAYTPHYCIVLEDRMGNRFSREDSWQDVAMMNPAHYLTRCMELAPDELSYLLFVKQQEKSDGEDVVEQTARLLSHDALSRRYRGVLMTELLAHCQKAQEDHLYHKDGAESYLQQVDAGILPAAGRRQLAELYVQENQFEKAYALIQTYGYEQMGSAARVALCSYAVTEAGFEEDDFLMGFAESTFLQGKYNDILLIYLCKYYNGATRRMAEVWKAAGAFQIDTFDLEERILTQMLYTTEYTPYAEQIYDSYYAGGGREIVCMAYLSYFSHVYLTQDAVVPSHVFAQVQDRLRGGRETNDVCRLGLLKHLAEREHWTEAQVRLADELLEEYVERGICFSFYRRFPSELLHKYQLYDKRFLEYHTAPHQRVVIHFRMGEEAYRAEELAEVYDGIYVRGFVLFFGEALQYYITEDSEEGQKVVESECLQNHDVSADDREQGRFARINEMLLQMTLEDREALKRRMKDYYRELRVGEEAFKLL